MRSQKGFAPIFLLLMIVVIAMVAGIAYYFVNLRNQYQSAVVTENPQFIPSPISEPSANWKTYNNTQKGFSIDYPSAKLIRFNCPNEDLDLVSRHPEDGSKETIQMPACDRDGRYNIEVQAPDNPLSTEPKTDASYLVVKDQINVAGLMADRFIITEKPSCQGICLGWNEEIRLSAKGRTFYFYINHKELLADFEQMLTTFKITN